MVFHFETATQNDACGLEYDVNQLLDQMMRIMTQPTAAKVTGKLDHLPKYVYKLFM